MSEGTVHVYSMQLPRVGLVAAIALHRDPAIRLLVLWAAREKRDNRAIVRGAMR